MPGKNDTMTEKTRQYRLVRSGKLLRRVRREFRALRGEYAARFAAERTDAQNMIFENFGFIEKNARELLRFDRDTVLTVGTDGLPVLGEAVFAVCRGGELPADEALTAAVNDLRGAVYLRGDELEAVRFCLQYTAFLHLCAAYREDEPAQRIADCLGRMINSASIPMPVLIASCCEAEQLFMNDEVYKKMDYESRRHYRRMLSRLAAATKTAEPLCARELLDESGGAHFGALLMRLYRAKFPAPKPAAYTWLLTCVSLAVTICAGIFTRNLWIVVPLFFVVWEIAKCVIDLILSEQTEETYLPRFSPESGEGDENCLAVISALVDGRADVDALCEHMRVLRHRECGANVRIMGLCDFKGAPEQLRQEDFEIAEYAREKIARLNEEYPDSFMLIIRGRNFIRTQNEFGGYERKRGAIVQLCAMMRGSEADFFCEVTDRDFLKSCRWICALDFDTLPQMDAIRRLLCIVRHPLNAPVVENGAVTSGYGIVTPRMVSHLRCAIRSPFARLTGGLGSTGAYSASTKNLYQDAFSSGIFSGKGLLDVDVFNAVTAGKFPEERILSHDILEGELMKTCYAGDVCFYESFPEGSRAFFLRHHRWTRGDIQNLRYLFTRDRAFFDAFARFKLWDNARRAATPVLQFAAFFLAFIVPTREACALAALTVFSLVLPSLLRFFRALGANGFSVLSRKFYAPILSETTESVLQGGWALVMLPKFALTSLAASVKSLWRMTISGKHLLDWTPSHAGFKSGVLKQFGGLVLPELFAFALLFSPCAFVRYTAVIFTLSLPLVVLSESLYTPPRREKLTPADRAQLKSQLTDIVRFFNEFVTAAENHLPPDNVQFAPVYRIAHRTSPTNIGLYLLTLVAAHDFSLIDGETLEARLNATLTTVEQMKKHRGNLYNWYETKTLRVCEKPFLSAVDSGNFVCCLVCLRECLDQLRGASDGIADLITRIQRLIEQTQLVVFFDHRRKLFHIGLDENLRPTPAHYDLLMSESRMLSYYAVAARQVPYEHWNHLGRTMSTYQDFAGAISFSGTMFEFFMPELFLKSETGSLCYESLRFALMCQMARAGEAGVPFGISESGYFAFDGDLNYQYKAHGVQRVGLRRDLDKELVVSPYSTYLALSHAGRAAADNLALMKKTGLYGVYGFYEAIDFTGGRCPANGTIVKSYMSHHMGMSVLGIANALNKGRFSAAFMRDEQMNSARELLAEKPYTGGVYIEDILRRAPKLQLAEAPEPAQGFSEFSPFKPRVRLLSNGEYTLAAADTGTAYALCRGGLVYAAQDKPLANTRGAYFAAAADGETAGLSYLPDFVHRDGAYVNFYENAVRYCVPLGAVTAEMQVTVHDIIPAELRAFRFRNNGTDDCPAELYGYLEPVLMPKNDFTAHPAFARMFLDVEYDYEAHFVLITRTPRAGTDKKYCAVGFLSGADPEFMFSREQVLRETGGFLTPFTGKEHIHSSLNFIPDPCVFVKRNFFVLAGQEVTDTLFIVCADTEAVLRDHVKMLRTGLSGQGRVLNMPGASTLTGLLLDKIAAHVLFASQESRRAADAVTENSRMVYELGRFGINPTEPLIMLELREDYDRHKAEAYLDAHRFLRLAAVESQLVLLAETPRVFDEMKNLLDARKNSHALLSDRRLFLLSAAQTDADTCRLLRATALHFCADDADLLDDAPVKFTPLRIEPMKPAFCDPQLKTAYGGFSENSFLVGEKPPAPWCNILASAQCGTLLSSRSLGFTYAVNSRENKLTPWENDPLSDNRGERLVLRTNGRYYDLVDGALAEFSPDRAVYAGENALFSSVVTVTVSATGFCKKISVRVTPKAKLAGARLAFYAEPVLGVDRARRRFLVPQETQNGILFSRPADSDTNGWLCVSCSAKPDAVLTAAEAFFSGKWDTRYAGHSADPCAALILKQEGAPLSNGKFAADFFLSFGKTADSAAAMPALYADPRSPAEYDIRISTPDSALNHLFNTWLWHQTYTGRILGRTGFYQCSGAYGFRDQLQDACAVLLKNPQAAKRHILRCCTAQFQEGDALHWWHTFPGGKKRGVRTRISDDLLFLPYTLAEYLDKTGDTAILSVQAAFCTGIELSDGESDCFGETHSTTTRVSVYNHARYAVERAYRTGRHGLILIGGGDWNDSFNEIGADGKGESVWLSMFMILVLRKFAVVCETAKCLAHADEFRTWAGSLENAVQKFCWDKSWYTRAFFGSGEKLGAHGCAACEIDSISQSFAVLAGLKNTERKNLALDSAYSRLVDEKNGIIKLFTPPFTGESVYAGYVNAYPAGIRENGGQYTHAAVWLAAAFLEAGRADDGWRLVKMLLPASKTETIKHAQIYRNEPYFVSADIYTNPQCYGRGGWSLYTGASGWLYRVILEWLLGIRICADRIEIAPHLPTEWEGFTAELSIRGTSVSVRVTRAAPAYFFDNGTPVQSVALDGGFHCVEIGY
ncbi:MAG: glucoamylase family protein [Oscillospiraceae bacterium]